MEFKTTFWNSRKSRRNREGFTLVELLIAIGISGLVLTVVLAMLVYSGYTFAGLANYADLNTHSLHALDRLSRDIRQATRLTSFAPTQLVFDDGTNKPPLIFAYSPEEKTLVRQQGVETEILLRECDGLRFAIYQRSPLPGTYDQHPAATTATAKTVVVSWVCSRQILGARFNTESVHTAKIVIRKE